MSLVLNATGRRVINKCCCAAVAFSPVVASTLCILCDYVSSLLVVICLHFVTDL